MDKSTIRAVIGVSFRRRPQSSEYETYYVQRSNQMQNYPGVWSLPSIQYESTELSDPYDLGSAAKVFSRLSSERLSGMPIIVSGHLITGSSDQNPMQQMVELTLYRIVFGQDPTLNPLFYTDAAWLTSYEFKLRSVISPLPCGLCTRLWEEYQKTRV